MKYLWQGLLHHDVSFLFRTDCSVLMQIGMNVLPVKNTSTSTSRSWSVSQGGSGICCWMKHTHTCVYAYGFLLWPILQKECDYAVSPLGVDVLWLVYITAQAMTIRTRRLGQNWSPRDGILFVGHPYDKLTKDLLRMANSGKL